MKTSQVVWIIIVLGALVFAEVFFLGNKTKVGYDVEFNFVDGDSATIQFAEYVIVTADSQNYFRIVTSDGILEAHPDPLDSNNFKASGLVSAEGWKVMDGPVHAVIENKTPIQVTKTVSPFMFWIFTLIFFVLAVFCIALIVL